MIDVDKMLDEIIERNIKFNEENPKETPRPTNRTEYMTMTYNGGNGAFILHASAFEKLPKKTIDKILKLTN